MVFAFYGMKHKENGVRLKFHVFITTSYPQGNIKGLMMSHGCERQQTILYLLQSACTSL